MLISNLAEKIGNRFFGNSEKLPLDVCIYGLELTISSFITTVLVIIIGILFGNIWLGVIYSVALSGIRIFSGGYHAKTYFRCGLVTVLTFLLSVAVYEYIINYLLSAVNLMIVIFFVITLTVLGVMAPIENENKKIMDKQNCKMIAMFICVAELMILYAMFNYLSFTPVIIIIPTQAVIVASIIFEYIIQKMKIKKEMSRNDEKSEKLIEKSC